MIDKYIAKGLHKAGTVYYILKSDPDEIKDCLNDITKILKKQGYHCVIPPRDCYIMWEKFK